MFKEAESISEFSQNTIEILEYYVHLLQNPLDLKLYILKR